MNSAQGQNLSETNTCHSGDGGITVPGLPFFITVSKACDLRFVRISDYSRLVQMACQSNSHQASE